MGLFPAPAQGREVSQTCRGHCGALPGSLFARSAFRSCENWLMEQERCPPGRELLPLEMIPLRSPLQGRPTDN